MSRLFIKNYVAYTQYLASAVIEKEKKLNEELRNEVHKAKTLYIYLVNTRMER